MRLRALPPSYPSSVPLFGTARFLSSRRIFFSPCLPRRLSSWGDTILLHKYWLDFGAHTLLPPLSPPLALLLFLPGGFRRWLCAAHEIYANWNGVSRIRWKLFNVDNVIRNWAGASCGGRGCDWGVARHERLPLNRPDVNGANRMIKTAEITPCQCKTVFIRRLSFNERKFSDFRWRRLHSLKVRNIRKITLH